MIHPSAFIDPSAEIASDVEIGPAVFIGPQVTIGSGSVLHHNCSVMCNTKIGERNVIHPGAVIGGDPQDKKWGQILI